MLDVAPASATGTSKDTRGANYPWFWPPLSPGSHVACRGYGPFYATAQPETLHTATWLVGVKGREW
jgi:hypothetical protein